MPAISPSSVHFSCLHSHLRSYCRSAVFISALRSSRTAGDASTLGIYNNNNNNNNNISNISNISININNNINTMSNVRNYLCAYSISQQRQKHRASNGLLVFLETRPLTRAAAWHIREAKLPRAAASASAFSESRSRTSGPNDESIRRAGGN